MRSTGRKTCEDFPEGKEISAVPNRNSRVMIYISTASLDWSVIDPLNKRQAEKLRLIEGGEVLLPSAFPLDLAGVVVVTHDHRSLNSCATLLTTYTLARLRRQGRLPYSY